MKKKVVIAISGGIDSAVACHLLKEQGYDVIAVHAVCYNKDVPFCTAQRDREDAIKIASYLNIPLKIIDLTKEYEELVINNMVHEYEIGLTPNPDVFCNRYVKFDLIYNYCKQNIQFDYFATGHYAKVSNNGLLQSPKDLTKDQTYFLWDINKELFDKLIFPLGELLKTDVRVIADKINLPNKNKPDSQGLCFIGNVKIEDFLRQYLPNKKGNVIDNKGNVIGEHNGHYFYTIGQRHNFKLFNYSPDPVFIVKKDADKNILIVGSREELYKDLLIAQFNYFYQDKISDNIYARIRNLGELTQITAFVTENDNEFILKITDDSQKFYAPARGQSVVLYNSENEVIGGGIIV